MKIIRLTDTENLIFDAVCTWNYEWWGKASGLTPEDVRCKMAHSVNDAAKLPQTFVAVEDGTPLGMYQLSMSDDLESRPDVYPWLINVYVDKAHRGKQICRHLMETVAENAKEAGLTELYLYTHHVGLYEKFGWNFVEFVKTFKKDSPEERLYELTL